MSALSQFTRTQLAPPKYLSLPTAGLDISAGGVKAVLLAEHHEGLQLASVTTVPLPLGSLTKGEITDPATISHVLREKIAARGISTVNSSLPEARGYLFEATVPGDTENEWRSAVEQHLDEYVPLPPADVVFDIIPISEPGTSQTRLVGVGYARRVLEQSLAVLDDAHILTRALESETFALPRAVLSKGSTETVLIIDLGKSSTKLIFVSHRIPRLATTLDIGGHTLTLAVQKYFGVTEEEAKKVKAERGLVQSADNSEYIASMFSTISVIREEIMRRIGYWESRKATASGYEPISRVILVGGNANVLGLAEYLETALKIPVELGDVFTNFAPRTNWLPSIDFNESLAYGTAIGLALREYES